MANDIANFIPKLAAMMVPVLRENMVLPRMATREPVSLDTANQGDTITISEINDLAAIPVVPANYAPDPQNIGGTARTVQISDWYEVPFQINDKEMTQIEDGFLPRVAEKAVIALANVVQTSILATFRKGFPLSVGTPGTPPFQVDLDAFFEASLLLDEHLVPPQGRATVLSPRAYTNAMKDRALQDTSWRGRSDVMDERRILHALGVDWEQTTTVSAAATQGTGTGYLAAAAGVAGQRFLPIDTGTGTWLAGDVFTIAGDTEPYAVTSYSGGVLNFAPGLRYATVDNAAITRVPSNGVTNFLVHPSSWIFVNRPLATDEMSRRAGGVFETITDPESGLSFRLELLREHKRVRWSIDMLWGSHVTNEDGGVRIYG